MHCQRISSTTQQCWTTAKNSMQQPPHLQLQPYKMLMLAVRHTVSGNATKCHKHQQHHAPAALLMKMLTSASRSARPRLCSSSGLYTGCGTPASQPTTSCTITRPRALLSRLSTSPAASVWYCRPCSGGSDGPARAASQMHVGQYRGIQFHVVHCTTPSPGHVPWKAGYPPRLLLTFGTAGPAVGGPMGLQAQHVFASDSHAATTLIAIQSLRQTSIARRNILLQQPASRLG